MSVPPTIRNAMSQVNERRFCPRETLEWVALVYFGENNWGKLIDLSKKGMRVEFAQPPSDPGPINFRLEAMGHLPSSFGGEAIINSFRAAGEVRWTRDFERTAGVHFINLPEGSREQIQKWLSFGHSADSGPSSNETEPEAPASPLELLEPPSDPPETRPQINEDEMQVEVACNYPGSEPCADSLTDLTSPFAEETLEVPVVQDYSPAMPEEESKNRGACGSYFCPSRNQAIGMTVGLAVVAVIAGIGMTLPRLAYRVPVVERVPGSAAGESEPVSAGYGSVAGSQRPFLVEVLDANNRRWLLWFDDSSSKNSPTQASYKSSLPFSTPPVRGASRPRQIAAYPKPSVPHKFTLVAPKASGPQANSSATSFLPLAAPEVRDELQPPVEAPIASVLAPPKPVEEFAPVGGRVQPARLLKSVPPVYPPFAKSSHVQGDVTLDALIDAAGNVTQLKVISGPAVLQRAAIDAVRQWKYEPARLDGQPVALHLSVTVKFHIE